MARRNNSQEAKDQLAENAVEATVEEPTVVEPTVVETAQEETKAAEPSLYDRDYLISNAAAFNVAPEIVAGALYDKETATQEEATAAIKAFLEKPKTAPEEEKGASE